MTDEELKEKIIDILDLNIWFNEGDAFHYYYDDMMLLPLLELLCL